MIAHAFPPLAASGGFRSARFARFLPEFGWEPIVLTIREDSVGSDHSLDTTLNRLVPLGLPVERTDVFRPFASTMEMAAQIKRGLRRFATLSTARSEVQSAADAFGRRSGAVTSSFRRLITSLVTTPDSETGWILPAIWSGMQLVRRNNPAAIFCTGPPHSAHLTACLLGKLFHKPVLLDFRDPWARKPWLNGQDSIIAKYLERLCIHNAAGVVTNTEAALDDFRKVYSDISCARFVCIPNGADPDFAAYGLQTVRSPIPSSTSEKSHIFCHPGEIYGKRSLIPFLRALAILRTRRFPAQFEQIGNVGPLDLVRSEIKRLELRDIVTLHGHLPHAETLLKMKTASFLLVIQPETATQVPAKIFEMLHFEKPLLALTGTGATAKFVEQYGLGRVENSDDPTRIADAVEQLFDSRFRVKASAGWHKARTAFDGRLLTGRLAESLDAIVRRHAQESSSFV